MKSLFTPSDRQQILDRLGKLPAGATRQWGKMDPAQMCAHCAVALEVATGDLVRPHAFIGKVLGRFVKTSLLGEKPFSAASRAMSGASSCTSTSTTTCGSSGRDASREEGTIWWTETPKRIHNGSRRWPWRR